MKAISAHTMRELDNGTIESGVPGEELMERAGYGAFRELMNFCESMFSEHAKRFLILNGKGNNGGDGYVIARYLHEVDLKVKVISTCELDELKGDARLNAERLDDDIEVVVRPSTISQYLLPGTIVVDALLGTGISGEVKGLSKSYIEEVNASGLPVVAVDIPSGLNADTGEVGNVAIVSDLTITMALPKTGLLCREGSSHTGMLKVIDIGILPGLEESARSAFDAITAGDISSNIGRTPQNAHKGNMGRIMIIGGSLQYPGALMLSATACARSGGGLVTSAFPTTISPLLPARPAALIMHPVPDGGKGHFNLEAAGSFAEFLDTQDVIVLGPGVGRSNEAMAFVRTILESDKPLVLDADGLHVLCATPDVLPREGTTVLTPHPGEMHALLKAIGQGGLVDADRKSQARATAQALDSIIVLKGAHTVVASPDGSIAVNTSGTSALATGGSGDVLSGMIGAWLAQLDDPFEAVKTAVYIHGYIAEIAPDSSRSLIADDLCDLISPAMANLSPHS